MNQQVQLTSKRNIMTESALFAVENLETFYKESPKIAKFKIEFKTLNQTKQQKEKQTLKVSKPSIVINSFACLCPACATYGAE